MADTGQDNLDQISGRTAGVGDVEKSQQSRQAKPQDQGGVNQRSNAQGGSPRRSMLDDWNKAHRELAEHQMAYDRMTPEEREMYKGGFESRRQGLQQKADDEYNKAMAGYRDFRENLPSNMSAQEKLDAYEKHLNDNQQTGQQQLGGQDQEQRLPQVSGRESGATDQNKSRQLRQAQNQPNTSAPNYHQQRGDLLNNIGSDLNAQRGDLQGNYGRQDTRTQRVGRQEFGLQDDMLANKQAILKNLKDINANRGKAARYGQIADTTQNAARKEKALKQKEELLNKNKELFEKNKALNKSNKDLKTKLNKVQAQKSVASMVVGSFVSTKSAVWIALIANLIVDLIGIFSVQAASWIDWVLDILLLVGNGVVASLFVKRFHLPGIAAYGVPVAVGLLEVIPVVGILPFWTIMAFGALLWLYHQEFKQHLQELDQHLKDKEEQRQEERQANEEARQARVSRFVPRQSAPAEEDNSDLSQAA